MFERSCFCVRKVVCLCSQGSMFVLVRLHVCARKVVCFTSFVCIFVSLCSFVFVCLLVFVCVYVCLFEAEGRYPISWIIE